MNRRNKIKSMKPINDKDLGKTEANIEATASEEMGLIILLQGRKKHRSGWDDSPGSLVTLFGGPGI
jgi:hypothetical protein